MTNSANIRFQIPDAIDHMMAMLEKQYATNGNNQLRDLLANARYYLINSYVYDNWNGGTYGHALVMELSHDIYYNIMPRLSETRDTIQRDMNACFVYPGEHIADVQIKLALEHDVNTWRERVGLLPAGAADARLSDEQLGRLWVPEHCKLFISHKWHSKDIAVGLKTALQEYGVSCFVAHADIQPSSEWVVELERALRSMDALCALLTSDFRDSEWTDQEIGAAIGRSVPVLPVRYDIMPYGFIDRYQAIPGIAANHAFTAVRIYESLWRHVTCRNSLVNGLVVAIERSNSYRCSRALMGYLDKLEWATPAHIQRLEMAYRNNDQLYNCYEVQDKLPKLLGKMRTGQNK